MYICIRTHDTGYNSLPIFIKLTWLVRLQPWVNPIVFGNNRSNRTTDIGENVPTTPVLCIEVRQYGFFKEET